MRNLMFRILLLCWLCIFVHSCGYNTMQKNEETVLKAWGNKERKIRIEVGYGLEGSLTDLMAGRIIRNVLVPQFRAGNFDQGVLDGVQAMIGVVRGEYQAPEKIPSRRSSKVNGTYLGLVGFIVCIFLISTLGKLIRFFGVGHSQRSHRGAGWSGGSGGGRFSSGGFSGGGGGFGGGGASGG